MKLLILLTVITCLQSSARGYGQTVTLSLENAPLEKAFKEIKKQTGYSFVYTRIQLKNTLPVTCEVKNGNLQEALDLCFLNQPLSYLIEDRYIVVQTKRAVTSPPTTQPLLIDITGKVINEEGEALAGVTITAKNSNKATSTNEQGEFVLKGINDDDVLIFTSVGYYKEELSVNKQSTFIIRLRIAVGSLDETIIKGYYNTTKRLNTGSVSKITEKDIITQPVSNPLATLHGRVPGLLIKQGNGLPGSNFSVTIRGRNSIQNGNSPLYILDGVPFVNDADFLTQRSSINAASPFNTIDPSQIESIEVLKDADATAIYGARGANGVILITTRKGKSEKLKINFQTYSGWGKVTRTMNYLTTQEYINMRREALANDGETATPSNAYDFLAWDSTRYTDLKKELIGGTARLNNMSIQLTGGNSTTKFIIGGNYHKETTVFPGNSYDRRISTNFGLTYQSPDHKLYINIYTNFASDKNNLIMQDITQYVSLPPTIPELYDSTGKLNWAMNGFTFSNPLSNVFRKYNVITDRITGSGIFQYTLFPGLKVKINAGYNQLQTDESSQTPISSQNPTFSPTGSSFFGTNQIKSWIAEPQIDFETRIFKQLKVQALVGSTWQRSIGQQTAISARGYTNDNLLTSTAGAQTITAQNGNDRYHYSAGYTRINLNWNDKYLINLTGRRDGSSRFADGKQFANFGAVGMAWILTSEEVIHKNVSFINFGKLKFSYGITGNDLIGNYKYLDSYSPTDYPYQGAQSMFPTSLFNNSYSWEQIRKMDIGIELGFFNDKVYLNMNWFRNKSDNQIVRYILPGQTGFSDILKNFPGVVKNEGLELQLNSTNINTPTFSWSTAFNFTRFKNELIKFPGLESSSYASRYRIGKPLTIYLGAPFVGVDPTSGVYIFRNKDNQPTFSPSSRDYIYTGTTDPDFFGGLQNTLKYKNWELVFLLEFRKQKGLHPIYSAIGLVGDANNQPVAVLERWQKPGDVAQYQRYTQTFTAAGNAIYPLYNSTALLTNASYLRLKNVSFSYMFPPRLLNRKAIESIRLFFEAQNLFVLTPYIGADPETQSIRALPPLRMLAIGVHLNF